jgi:Fe2+ or Zn2+ uptake regulation protein
MVIDSAPAASAEAVAEAKTELLQAFGAMGGVTARAEDFGRVLPRCLPEAVYEALDLLIEEGIVEVASLSDGDAVYHFIRH